MRSTAAKKRAGLPGVESGYLFGNFCSAGLLFEIATLDLAPHWPAKFGKGIQTAWPQPNWQGL